MGLIEQWRRVTLVQDIHNIHFAKPLNDRNLGLGIPLKMNCLTTGKTLVSALK